MQHKKKNVRTQVAFVLKTNRAWNAWLLLFVCSQPPVPRLCTPSTWWRLECRTSAPRAPSWESWCTRTASTVRRKCSVTRGSSGFTEVIRRFFYSVWTGPRHACSVQSGQRDGKVSGFCPSSNVGSMVLLIDTRNLCPPCWAENKATPRGFYYLSTWESSLRRLTSSIHAAALSDLPLPEWW